MTSATPCKRRRTATRSASRQARTSRTSRSTRTFTLIGTAGKALTIVDGNAAGSVVSVQGSSGYPGIGVGMEGLTLRNGTAAKGGGVYCAGYGDVSLSNSTVSGNVATSQGGGIYTAAYSGMSLSDCVIRDNTATSGPGGAISSLSEFVTLTNCTISENTTASGAAVKFDTSWSLFGRIFITNATISNNSGDGLAMFDVYYARATRSTISGK